MKVQHLHDANYNIKLNKIYLKRLVVVAGYEDTTAASTSVPTTVTTKFTMISSEMTTTTTVATTLNAKVSCKLSRFYLDP